MLRPAHLYTHLVVRSSRSRLDIGVRWRRRSNEGTEGARRFREIRSEAGATWRWQGGAEWLGSALRRSSLDEEVVCGGQAWPAYQIRGVFWSCSRYGVLAFQENDLPTSLPSSFSRSPPASQSPTFCSFASYLSVGWVG